VTGLELSLITGGFIIAAVLVAFGGSYLLEQARSRRDARQLTTARPSPVSGTALDAPPAWQTSDVTDS